MQDNDKMTGKELSSAVLQETGISITAITARTARKSLGWTLRGTGYCQPIRVGNHVKRFDWAKENMGASLT